MRITVLISVVIISQIGCASVERVMHNDHMSYSERKEYEAKLEKEKAEKEEAKKNIQPGMAASDVKEKWGEPDQVEFMNGQYIWRYENAGNPVNFYIDNNKLAGWKFDHQAAIENRKLAVQKKQNEDFNRQMTWSNMFGAANAVNGLRK